MLFLILVSVFDGGMEFKMKKIVSLLLATILLCGALFSLSSCNDAPEDAGAQISVYLGQDIMDFDPTDYYADSAADQVMSLLFEPLFKLDEDGDLEYAAADDYDVDESERKIVIDIRETYWSDEIRVKAEDYIYAWSSVLLNTSNPNPAAALIYDIENAIAIKAGASSADFGAIASDTYEITITYREGADYEQLLKNLASTATAPLRRDIVENAKTYWSKDVSKIVTNGPFRLSSYSVSSDDLKISEFTLARNLGYHQDPTVVNYTDKVTPASLVTFVSPDADYVISYDDIVNKTVFYMGDATLEDRAANADAAEVIDDLSTYSYVFNTENPLFASADVRRALSVALDREKIAEAVTFGKAATGFLPDPIAEKIYGEDANARLSGDMTEAKSLIAKALADRAISRDDMKFTLTVNADEESIAIANRAKSAWGELGFDVKIKAVSVVTSKVTDTTVDEKITIYDSAIQTLVKEASYGNRDFDVIAVDWQMYSTDAFVALSAFTSHMNGCGTDLKVDGARSNISGWDNFDYDRYLNVAYQSEGEERAAALRSAEDILLKSAPIIPVLYNQNFAFISEDLSSISVDGFGNFILTKVEQDNYQDYLPKED